MQIEKYKRYRKLSVRRIDSRVPQLDFKLLELILNCVGVINCIGHPRRQEGKLPCSQPAQTAIHLIFALDLIQKSQFPLALAPSFQPLEDDDQQGHA